MAYVPFPNMVGMLFKTAGFEPKAEAFVHAAVGIIGEVIELRQYEGIENLIEEFGDLEFYLEAYLHQIRTHCSIPEGEPDGIFHLGSKADPNYHFDELISKAETILDHTKKVWVYGAPAASLMTKAYPALLSMRETLLDLYLYYGVTREAVLDANQLKLGKRFPGLVYTNYAAQSRADKQGA